MNPRELFDVGNSIVLLAFQLTFLQKLASLVHSMASHRILPAMKRCSCFESVSS